jgi:hypothetical protein
MDWWGGSQLRINGPQHGGAQILLGFVVEP